MHTQVNINCRLYPYMRTISHVRLAPWATLIELPDPRQSKPAFRSNGRSKMPKLFARTVAVAVFLTALLVSRHSHATIVYNIFDDFGTATISGTITTDGTIGAVGNGNITDWSLSLISGAGIFSLTKSPLNSELYSGNGVLQASVTELAFDHSVNHIFLIRNFPIQNFWCLEGPNSGCFGTPSSSNVSVGGRFNQHVNIGRTGLHVYGTVPVPAALPLMAAGHWRLSPALASAALSPSLAIQSQRVSNKQVSRGVA